MKNRPEHYSTHYQYFCSYLGVQRAGWTRQWRVFLWIWTNLVSISIKHIHIFFLFKIPTCKMWVSGDIYSKSINSYNILPPVYTVSFSQHFTGTCSESIFFKFSSFIQCFKKKFSNCTTGSTGARNNLYNRWYRYQVFDSKISSRSKL
jgi:hypothetical protein